MKLLTLSCNECGAPLEVPADAKYVTCGYCSARLAVQHTSNAAYTETLEALSQRTEKIADDIETLKLQNELERLERQWSEDRQTYMVHDKEGNQSTPSAAGSIVGAIIAAGFGILWMGFAASIGAPGFFPLFGLLFVIAAIFIGLSGATKASAYNQALARYEHQRAQLAARLQARESGESPFGHRES